MFFKRLFWGTVSFVWIIPLFWVVDHLHIGGRNEDIAFSALLTCGWGISEAFVRKSFFALIFSALIPSIAAILLTLILPPDLMFVTAAALTTLGLASTSLVADHSRSLAWRILLNCSTALCVGGATAFLAGRFIDFGDPFLLWLGFMPQLGAALAHHRYTGAKTDTQERVQFSLGSAVLSLLFACSIVTSAYVCLRIGPVTPTQAMMLDAMGQSARSSLENWSPPIKRPKPVDQFLVEACRQGKTFEFAETYIGKSHLSSRKFQSERRLFCYRDGNENHISAYSNSGYRTIDHLTGYGTSDEMFAYSRRSEENRTKDWFTYAVTAALPISLLIVAGIERLRKKRATPSTP
jgi:hypothetical protein